MEKRKINVLDIRELILSGVPNDVIKAKFNLTPTQLHMILERLKQKGLLSDGQRCPACGFIQESSFIECPKCGVLTNKIGKVTTVQTNVVSQWIRRVLKAIDDVWDRIDCGAYRWLKSKGL